MLVYHVELKAAAAVDPHVTDPALVATGARRRLGLVAAVLGALVAPDAARMLVALVAHVALMVRSGLGRSLRGGAGALVHLERLVWRRRGGGGEQ